VPLNHNPLLLFLPYRSRLIIIYQKNDIFVTKIIEKETCKRMGEMKFTYQDKLQRVEAVKGEETQTVHETNR